MPSGIIMRQSLRKDNVFQTDKFLLVPFRGLVAEPNKFIQLFQLGSPKRGLDVAHPVIEAKRDHDVFTSIVFKNSVATQELDCFVKLLVIRKHGSALPCRDRLDRVKAQGREVGQAPDAPAAIAGPEGMGRVLNEQKFMLFGNSINLFHFRGLPAKTPPCQGPGAFRNQALNFTLVYVIGIQTSVKLSA